MAIGFRFCLVGGEVLAVEDLCGWLVSVLDASWRAGTYTVRLCAVEVPDQILVDLRCGWGHHLISSVSVMMMI